jgi:hypothetical protein
VPKRRVVVGGGERGSGGKAERGYEKNAGEFHGNLRNPRITQPMRPSFTI